MPTFKSFKILLKFRNVIIKNENYIALLTNLIVRGNLYNNYSSLDTKFENVSEFIRY